MTLLAVERIKLFSTRSPYWCLAAIAAAALAFALLMGGVDGGRQASTAMSQSGLQLGMIVFMVLAALAVTAEYRFGTIKASFLAVPQRVSVLAAKTALLVLIGAVAAAVCGLAAFFLTKALGSPQTPMTLSTGDDWRMVLGSAALFAVAGVIAVAAGTLIRHSAGAITILLLWPLLLEKLVQIIPGVGSDIHNWMPFNAGSSFVSSSGNRNFVGQVAGASGPTAIEGLLVFAGTAAVLWVLAAIVLRRRDA